MCSSDLLGDFSSDDESFKMNRLTTLNEIDKYYRAGNEISLSVPIPLFNPSDKIELNNQQGMLNQWENYISMTRKAHAVKKDTALSKTKRPTSL